MVAPGHSWSVVGFLQFFFSLYLQSGMGADRAKGTMTRKIGYKQAIKMAAFK